MNLRRLGLFVLLLLALATPSQAAFTYYKAVTYASAQAGTADSTNYPLLLSRSSDSGLNTHARSDGHDIRPYLNSDCATGAMTFELVSYVTGTLEMWVSISTLSHTADGTFYLCYGDNAVSGDGSSNATWPSNAKAAFHFADGTTLNLVDSTATPITLTNHSTTATTGQIDGGVNVGGSTNYLDADNNSKLNGTGTVSISAWVNIASFPSGSAIQNIAGKGYDSVRVPIYFDVRDVSGTPHLHFGYYDGSTHDADWATSGWSTSTWHYVVGTWDASTYTVYFDGVSKATQADSTARVSDTNLFTIGALDLNGSVSRNWSGSLDEERIWDTALSASWITADYNSQKSSQTMVTYGSETALGGGATPTSPTLPLLGAGPG